MHQRWYVIVLQVALEVSSQLPSFEVFVRWNNRSYVSGSPEYNQRHALFEKRRLDADHWNQNVDRLWSAGVNSFSDWTDIELRALFGRSASRFGTKINSENSSRDRVSARNDELLSTVFLHPRLPEKEHTSSEKEFQDDFNGRISFVKQSRQYPQSPEEQSWSHLVAMQEPVQEQGDCGSCWAIATSMLLRAHTEIHQKQARVCSTQELLSCVPNPSECGGKGGCRGATMSLGLDWVWRNGCTEEHHEPYLSGETGKTHTCNRIIENLSPPTKHSFGMLGWQRLPQNQQEPLMRGLVELGPVGVSVASNEWLPYARGIFDGCSKYAVINHAVILFAYGKDLDNKYWTIRNSWGADWGEQGNMRLLRRDDDEHNWCGLDYEPEVGTGCKGGPESVTVCGMCGILYSQVVPMFSSAL